MNSNYFLDVTDRIDLICTNLDQAEGILSALEATLSISDTHHPALPHAVTAAMQFVANSKDLVKGASQEIKIQPEVPHLTYDA